MYLTALILGITGSLHCAGMCSPLAMAVTSKKSMGYKLLYNTGRIVSYGVLGAMAAQLGQFTSLSAYQTIFSIFLGVILLLMGFGAIAGISIPLITRGVTWITVKLKILFGKFLHHRNGASITILGMLNGLLPCGITSIALTYCLILPGATEGFLSMIIFGLGTWPVMIGFSWISGLVAGRFNISYQKSTMAAMIISGLLLIGHGTMGQYHLHQENLSVQEFGAINLCE
jgi:Uncharacterized conserved protein